MFLPFNTEILLLVLYLKKTFVMSQRFGYKNNLYNIIRRKKLKNTL